MSQTQVAAATTLLNKILPDLRSAEFKAEETKTYVIRAPEQSESMEAWLRDYAPRDIAEQQLELIGPTKA